VRFVVRGALADAVLDYFGQTVNIAARLQAEATAGELVVPEDLANAAAGGGWLAGAVVTDRCARTLKGFDAPLAIARVRSQLALVAPPRGGRLAS